MSNANMLFAIFYSCKTRRFERVKSRRSPHPAAPAAWPRRPPSGLPQAYARSEVIEQHAEWVWGAAWKMEDRPAPKVVSLVWWGKFVLEGHARGMSGGRVLCQQARSSGRCSTGLRMLRWGSSGAKESLSITAGGS